MNTNSKMAHIPNELKQRPQWVCWKREMRDGKQTKVPYIADTGECRASSTNPATWRTFEEACRHAARFDGIGFVFAADDPYCGIDLDHAIDPGTGEVHPDALEILRGFPSYTEVSPSGTGLHILCRAALSDGGTKKPRGAIEVEMYDRGRYFTVTGARWADSPDVVEDCQTAAAALYAELKGRNGKKALVPPTSQPPNFNDEELLAKARNAANGAEFSSLFDDGDNSAFGGDESRADFALCSHLNFWTGNDADRVDRLFRQSALMRDKWERPDYRERTITNTHADNPYTPGRNGRAAPKGETRLQPCESLAVVGGGQASADINLRRFPPTDAGNAEMFAALCGGTVRYMHGQDRWLIWRGHWWQDDTNGKVVRLAKSCARTRFQLTWDQIQDEKERKASAVHSMRSEQASGIAAMLKLARAEYPITVGSDEFNQWDADPWLIAVTNGIVDLRTGDLRPGQRDDRITMHLLFAYDPDATCPRWEQFIAEVLDGDPEMVAYLRRQVGYSLTGLTSEQVWWLLYGKGANGKSVFLETLADAFAPLALTTPFATFEKQRPGAIPNDLAALAGRHLVIASETNENAKLNEARIKGVVHGGPQSARFLNKEFFTFNSQVKLWLGVNHKPSVADDSKGFWRSVHMIPFTRTFEGADADPHLKDKLMREAPGIFVWAVRGCLEWQRVGLRPPGIVTEATEEYRREADPLAEFIADTCVTGPDYQARARKLAEAYGMWAEAQGMRERDRLSVTALGRRMKDRDGTQSERTGAGIIYHGIGLKTDYPEVSDVD